MIDDNKRPQAQRAYDLLYTAQGAVEDCGADPALTDITVALGDAHRRLAELFVLAPGRLGRVIRADDIYPLDEDTIDGEAVTIIQNIAGEALLSPAWGEPSPASVRLECVRVASGIAAQDDILAVARSLYEFVVGAAAA